MLLKGCEHNAEQHHDTVGNDREDRTRDFRVRVRVRVRGRVRGTIAMPASPGVSA